ncbi:hypothetical protein MSAN_00676700 [Mycena sanguinolenta]|uniref:Uncharacterized protein n=1 Tax=Mycena sanguinolenta TaxID=230812 RepID=A0A8H7DDJ6_9AGAR|nr:hypothetical protein MSAN_00676700 [Mycena sanguinolenta]
MTTLSETSLSILSQSDSTSPPSNVTKIVLVPALVAAALYYVSPARLTRILVSAFANVENAYLKGVENGFVLTADTEIAERLAVLQLKVSMLHENSLLNSLSPLSAFYDMFDIRRSVVVLQCLREVRALKTQIEISHESHLREIASASEAHSSSGVPSPPAPSPTLPPAHNRCLPSRKPPSPSSPQSNPTSIPWDFTGILLLALVMGVVYYASPTRLTLILVSTLTDVENAYLSGVENGVFVASVDVDVAERLAVLQLKVSTIRETSLRSSLSTLTPLFHVLNVRRCFALPRRGAGIGNIYPDLE